MKRIEKADTATAKCPECGGKYVKATKYCPSCKKKVKEVTRLKDQPLVVVFYDHKGRIGTMETEKFMSTYAHRNEFLEDAVERFNKEKQMSGEDTTAKVEFNYNESNIHNTNIIELPEDVTIDMGDREVILEKGDRIKVVENDISVGDTIGGTSMKGGFGFVGTKAIDKLIALSQEYNDLRFVARTDNYTRSVPTFIFQNGIISDVDGNRITRSKVMRMGGMNSNIFKVDVKPAK